MNFWETKHVQACLLNNMYIDRIGWIILNLMNWGSGIKIFMKFSFRINVLLILYSERNYGISVESIRGISKGRVTFHVINILMREILCDVFEEIRTASSENIREIMFTFLLLNLTFIKLTYTCFWRVNIYP